MLSWETMFIAAKLRFRLRCCWEETILSSTSVALVLVSGAKKERDQVALTVVNAVVG